METLDHETIRVTISLNYRLDGRPHHPDEIVEAVNESFQTFIIPSDMASANPRWMLFEQFRDIVITGINK